MSFTKTNSFGKNKIAPVQTIDGPDSRDTIERAKTIRMVSPDPMSSTLDLVNEMTNNKHAFEERSKKLERELLLKVNELEQKIESYQKKIKLYRESIAKYKSLIDKNNDELEKSIVCNIL